MVTPLALGPSYAETLRLWDEAFLAASDRVLALGIRREVPADVALLPGVLPGRLRLVGYLDVNQLTFERPA